MKMNFNNQGYMTRGFEETIPTEVKILLSTILLNKIASNTELDYLQVITLTKKYGNGNIIQHISWEQEQPASKSEYEFPVREAVTCKVYCIDDETHHTYLLAEEY